MNQKSVTLRSEGFGCAPACDCWVVLVAADLALTTFDLFTVFDNSVGVVAEIPCTGKPINDYQPYVHLAQAIQQNILSLNKILWFYYCQLMVTTGVPQATDDPNCTSNKSQIVHPKYPTVGEVWEPWC